MSTNTKGKLGEILVFYDLLSRGHKIIARNVRVNRKEIDIITLFKDWLLLFEVRFRKHATANSDTSYTAEHWISNQKLYLFSSAAYLFIKNPKKYIASRNQIPDLSSHKIKKILAMVEYTQNDKYSRFIIRYIPI